MSKSSSWIRFATAEGLERNTPPSLHARAWISSRTWGPDSSLCDDSPLEIPPVAIVEAMMAPYFESISPRMPIWTRQGFGRLVDACQASGGNGIRHRACIVCANNIVLLTLTAKSLRLKSKKREQTACTDKQRLSSMELDLLKSFLANAKRALNKIEQLLVPSLANIQAILSMCLVVQQYLADDIFNLLFHQAAYLVRLVGLDCPQLSVAAGEYSLEDVQERQNVVRCLCILGSSVSWCSGFRPDFLTAGTIAAALASIKAHGASERSAGLDYDSRSRLTLALIEDELFTLAYSPRLDAKKPYEIQYGILVLRQQLEAWWSDCGDGNEMGADAEGHDGLVGLVSSSRTERAICFHTLRILMAWPTSDEYEDCSRGALDDARSCLKLFARAWKAGFDLGHYASLIRLLVSYPPVAFIQLLIHIVNNDGFGSGTGSSGGSIDTCAGEDDLELLQSFVDEIQTVADLGDPHSYMARLSSFARTLTDFAVAFRRSPCRPQPTSKPDLWEKSSGASLDVGVGALTTPGGTDKCEKNDQELEIDVFDMDSTSPFPNLPYQFNIADLNSEFFSG